MIDLYSRCFKTKEAAKRFCQELLHKYPPGERLSGDDDMDVYCLFKHHPEFQEKRGAGVLYFTVEHAFRGTKCFFVHREDGSSTDFSFMTCIYGSSKAQDFRKACREAVFTDIMNFRRTHLLPGSVCPITGEVLTEANTHVDHAPPFTFEAIVQQFVVDEKININGADIPKSDGFVTKFGDSELARKFREYHNARANLRLVSKTANLSTLKRKKAE